MTQLVSFREIGREEIPDAPGQLTYGDKRTRVHGKLYFSSGYEILTEQVSRGVTPPASGIYLNEIAKSITELPDLGTTLGTQIPGGITQWREGQAETLAMLMATPDDISLPVYLDAPTGSGKSLLAMGLARSRPQTAIITSTLNLQEQYAEDYNIPSITGRSHWGCDLTDTTADKALCTGLITANDCHVFQKGQCAYYEQRNRGKNASTVVTNVQFWLSTNVLSGHNIIIDEAHLLEKELREYQALRNIPIQQGGTLANILKRQLSGLPLFPADDDEDAWSQILTAAYAVLADENMKLRDMADVIQQSGQAMDDVSPELERLSSRIRLAYRQQQKVSRGITLLHSPHLKEITSNKFLTMEPLVGSRKVAVNMLMSATLIDPSLTDNDSFICLSLPSTFPKENRPVISTDTIRLSKATGDRGIKKLAWKLDQLMLQHSDEKGIVHCVSYELAAALKKASEYPSLIITHGPGGRDEAIERFKKAPPGRVLLSPSISQGVDLPYELCRWQMIAKVPFVNLGDRIEKARSKQMPELSDLDVARQLVQMSGRGMRAKDDKCVTYIVDGNFRWFYKKNFKLFPQWFREAVRFEAD